MIIILILLVIILVLLIVSRFSNGAKGFNHQNIRDFSNKKAVVSEVNIELTKRKEVAEAKAKAAALAKMKRDGILDKNSQKELTGQITTSNSSELSKRKEAAEAIAKAAAALARMKSDGILDENTLKKKEVTGQINTFKEYETLAQLIYTIYESVSKFRPVETERYEFEEELVISSRPYLNPNIQYNIDYLNEKHYKTFDDRQTFLKLVECLSKLDKVQSKYFNKISSLSSSRYTLSQSQLYELEGSHWNDTKDLVRSFQSAFDELFTKINEDLSYEKILEQKYYQNLPDHYYY